VYKKYAILLCFFSCLSAMKQTLRLMSVREVEFYLMHLSQGHNHPKLKSPCLPPSSAYLRPDFGLQLWNPCLEAVVNSIQPSVIVEFAQSRLNIKKTSPFLLTVVNFAKERYKNPKENEGVLSYKMVVRNMLACLLPLNQKLNQVEMYTRLDYLKVNSILRKWIDGWQEKAYKESWNIVDKPL